MYEKEPLITLDKELLIKILRKEDEIRKSDEIQELYSSMRFNWGKDEDYDGFIIDKACQIRALIHFGFEPEVDESLEAYHIACGTWIEDPEVKVFISKFERIINSLTLIRKVWFG